MIRNDTPIFVVVCSYKDEFNDFTEVDSCHLKEEYAEERAEKLRYIRNERSNFKYFKDYLKTTDEPLANKMILDLRKMAILKDVKIEIR